MIKPKGVFRPCYSYEKFLKECTEWEEKYGNKKTAGKASIPKYMLPGYDPEMPDAKDVASEKVEIVPDTTSV